MCDTVISSQKQTRNYTNLLRHWTQILPTISFLLTSGLLVMLLWDLITYTAKTWCSFISYFLGAIILLSLLTAAFIFSSPSNLVKNDFFLLLRKLHFSFTVMFCYKEVESLHYTTIFLQQILFSLRPRISYGIIFVRRPWIS